MGETDCSSSSNIATLKFELSENPILDRKTRHRKILVGSLKARNMPRTRSGGWLTLPAHLICPLVCRIVAREQYANNEKPQTA